MNEKINSEQSAGIEVSFRQLLDLEPKLITNFVAENAAEQKELFLMDEIESPNHVYDRLESEDIDARYLQIDQLGRNLLTDEAMSPKYTDVYESFINKYLKMTEMLIDAKLIKNADSSTEAVHASERFMRNNIELYGAPDKETYYALLNSKMAPIAKKELVGHAATLQEELLSMVNYQEADRSSERFTPSTETIEWVGEVVHELYDGMLSHVPDQDMFTPAQIRDLFDTILREEFGDSAEGWTVDLEPATSINVKAPEKRVVIPEARKDITQAKMKELVVHELGVHVLRAISGATTDLGPMETGFAGYYDSEEGLGVVMEQGLKGKFEERGVPLYITAGLAFYDNKDFRATYETKWRMSALTQCRDGEDIDDTLVKKAKNTAYAETNRIFRGTDELPWFKDLAYYNGAVNVWKHLEAIRGDYDKFQFVLMGKADSSNREQFRTLYETRTIA